MMLITGAVVSVLVFKFSRMICIFQFKTVSTIISCFLREWINKASGSFLKSLCITFGISRGCDVNNAKVKVDFPSDAKGSSITDCPLHDIRIYIHDIYMFCTCLSIKNN